MILTSVIKEADKGGYISFNPETGTTIQCESFEEEMAMLQQATELDSDEFPMEPQRS